MNPLLTDPDRETCGSASRARKTQAAEDSNASSPILLPPALTAATAKAHGYRPATYGYAPWERDMLRRALAQFAGVSTVLVSVPGGVEIWRKP